MRALAAVLVLGVCGGLVALRLSAGTAQAPTTRRKTLVPRAVRVTSPAETPSSAAACASSSTSPARSSRPASSAYPRVPGSATRWPRPAGRDHRADLGRVNLAAPLADGTQVYVPAVGEVMPVVVAPSPPAGAGTRAPASGRRRILRSTSTRPARSKLEGLPGVGPAIAAAIVRYRERAPLRARSTTCWRCPGSARPSSRRSGSGSVSEAFAGGSRRRAMSHPPTRRPAA